MICPRCEAENPDGARFCGRCGIALAGLCGSCGATNPRENRFCGQCGAPLGQASAPAPSREPTGEFKQVSILFCDIVDSTGLSERIGAEALHELLRRFLDSAIEVVRSFEGSVPQFTGDGFLALFGAPIATEDHARRALLAALAVRRMVGDAPADGDGLAALQVRMGINSGLVVFGAVAEGLRMDWTVVGDAANVAARLQSAANPGEIVIGEATLALTEGFARTEPVGTLALKGVSAPISAYRLTGVSSGTAAAPGRGAGRIFVGRGDELAVLHKRLADAASGRGRAVCICGEAGIGKSRLVAEFRRSLAARSVTWVEGRCMSYGAGIPYALMLDLLRGNCRIAEGDAPATIAGKIAAGLRAAGLDSEQEEPLLLDLLGIAPGPAPANPENVKRRAFDTFRQLAIGGSRKRPLVLFAEDMHWVDKVTEEFVAELVANIAGERILLLASYRPGYRPPWSDAPLAEEIALAPLTPAEGSRVLDAVLNRRPLPEGVADTILGRAEGNPFFIEQLALHAGEEPASTGGEAVPSTIRDVVMARIDRLPAATKRLLQTASVVGRQFSLRLLREVWQGIEPIAAQLAELTRLEFLQEQPEPAGPSYSFRHALTQDAAYAGLLARDRRRTHARVGRSLERLYSGHADEVTELLAWHWGRNDDAERAVDYAIAAAEKAQRRWANAEALSYFEDALKRLDGMPDTPANRLRRVDAVLKQAEVKFALGRHAEHIEALESIQETVESTGDARRRATWHYWMGFLHALTGSPPAMAIRHCHSAAEIAGQAGFSDLAPYIDSCLAQVCVVAGEFRAAIDAGDRALTAFERQGNIWWSGRTLWHLAAATNYLGRWLESREYATRAYEYGEASNDLRLKVGGLLRIASAYVQQGKIEGGLKYCEIARDLRPLAFDSTFEKTIRGYALIKSGRLESGIPLLREALDWFNRSHLAFLRIAPALRLAEGYIRQGDPQSAKTLICSVLEISETTGYRYLQGLAERLMAECLEAQSFLGAEQHLVTAKQIFEEIGAENDFAKSLMLESRLRDRAGGSDAAAQLRERAREIFKKIGTVAEPAQAGPD